MTLARKALITGCAGQDGAYLAKLLLEKGYEVYGAIRNSSGNGDARLRELKIADDVALVDLDITDFENVARVIESVEPDEVYNLAAQSLVTASFDTPVLTGDVNALGVSRLLEALRLAGSGARFYQASTSEMFGKAREEPQTELTPFHPRSPYAVAKVHGHLTTVNYREAHGVHASNGILFNHESPLRAQQYVTRKITLGLARTVSGQQSSIQLGNIDSCRDWGFAGDYADAIWRIVQQDEADDFVVATGVSTSVRDFARAAAAALDIDLVFEGQGVEEKGIDRETGRTIVEIDPTLFRPAEAERVVGDAGKAKSRLNWTASMSAEELAHVMAEADMRRVRDGTLLF